MSILTTIVVIIATISALFGTLALVWMKSSAAMNPKAEQVRLDEIHVIEAQIQTALFGIVTQFERQYGSGTGELKLAASIEKVITLLPENLRKYVNSETIVNWIENALAAAKKKWADNPFFVNRWALSDFLDAVDDYAQDEAEEECD